jgi:glycosyltransferase involved in cell wall biosynthesis
VRVNYYNTYLQGGAANASIRIFNQLTSQKQIEGVFFYMDNLMFNQNLKESKNPSYIQINPHLHKSVFDGAVKSFYAKTYYNKLKKTLAGKTKQYGIFNSHRAFYPLKYSTFEKHSTADLIHLNWIAEWIDYQAFFKSIPKNIPIVWTLHDMNPFTGGCHHSGECNNYKSDCFPCVQLEGASESKFARINLIEKNKVLEKKNLHIISPSKWMFDRARDSRLFKKANHYLLPNGIDTSIFKPQTDKMHGLGLPTDDGKIIILFVADNLNNNSKGYKYLLESMQYLSSHKDIVVVAIGEKSGKLIRNDRLIEYGRIDDPVVLSKIYSVADIFVAPSIEDTFPSTVIEAMACKTAVVGFKTGGIPDLVIDYKTGLLSKPGNSEDLAQKLSWMIDHPLEITKMSENAYAAAQNYSIGKQAEGYFELYKSLLYQN